MSTRFTIKELERLKGAGLIQDYSETAAPAANPKKSKYGNKKTEVDGIWFDSIREAKRYVALRYLLKAGGIKYLERQVEFELNEGGTHSLIYRADFVYETKEGKMVVEDSKGMRTREYKKKRRLMLEVHGIEIYES
jgi:hypothetical protein